MKRNDLSRSLVAFDQASTLVAVVELSLGSWLVAGLVPNPSRQPLKKLRSDPEALLGLLLRWRDQAIKAGGRIKRIVLAFEAGRDGFWLARWLRARGIETYVIHPSSMLVSREHRRVKTDRLDAGLSMQAVLGWLRGEPKRCSMAAIPTIAEEDARRPNRECETLVREQVLPHHGLRQAVSSSRSGRPSLSPIAGSAKPGHGSISSVRRACIGSSLTPPSRISLPRYGSGVGLHIVLCEACSAFTCVAACTLALSPIRDTLIEGFSHFVTSMTAPIASGWSDCRVGLAPTGKRRLCTAHAKGRHCVGLPVGC